MGTTSNTGNAADEADFDGDGSANLLEYASGTLPNSSSSTPAVTTAQVTSPGAGYPHLELSFARIADSTLIYTVESSTDLTSPWTPIWTSTGASNQAGPVTVADTVEISSVTPRRFLRLRITAP